jgi:hypothetical protein
LIQVLNNDALGKCLWYDAGIWAQPSSAVRRLPPSLTPEKSQHPAQ